MLYLYAITDDAAGPFERTGLHGSVLRTVGADGLYAVVSQHVDLRLEATEDDLWAHESVVEEVMERAVALPMRLGSVLADEMEVLELLRERREELTATLDRVRGTVELGVRAAIEPLPGAERESTPAGSGPGTAYMLRRLGQARRGAEVAARIHEPLAMLARESRHRLGNGAPAGGSRRPQLSASYLVDRGRVDRFRARVEELEDEVAEASIVCTGPWPPYSFTSTESGS